MTEEKTRCKRKKKLRRGSAKVRGASEVEKKSCGRSNGWPGRKKKKKKNPGRVRDYLKNQLILGREGS